jgi:serine O-acetyltransferase
MNAIKLYRISQWCWLHHLGFIAKFFRALIFLLYNSYILYTAEIGAGTKCGYKGMGVVIHSRTIIGRNCNIDQQVTIGGRSKHYAVPVIGDDCYLGAGAKILGSIKIGNGVVIGANAVMLSDAPDNTVWAGIPAKCIRKNIKVEDYV